MALASTVDRDRLAAAPNQMTDAERGADRHGARRHAGARRGGRGDASREPRHGPRLRRHRARRPALHVGADPGARWRPAGIAHVSLEPRAGPGLPAGGRRPGLDAGRPSARVRQPRGRRAVRGRAVLPVDARRARHGSRSRSATSPAGSLQDTAHVDDSGQPGTDLLLTIDAGLQLTLEQELLAAWIADKAKNVSAVVMDPVHRRDLRRWRRTPRTTRTTTARSPRPNPSRFVDPIVSQRLRAGLGVQDDDRGGGAREGHRHAGHADQGRRHAAARQRPARRSTTRTARAWAG